MEQEESLLTYTEIISSLEYKSESKTSTGSSSLPLYISSPLILPLLLPLPIDSPSSYNNMSQLNVNQFLEQIRVQQKQIVAL